MRAAPRSMITPISAMPSHIGIINCRVFFSDGRDRHTCVPRGIHDFVIDIRDVRGIGHFWISGAQQPDQQIEHDRQHWSRRSVHDINRDLWGGAIFKDTEGQSVYFTGDSGFHQALFEELAARYASPDIALVPIGAYEPRWFMQYAHMNPEEAVKVHQILSPKKSMGFHFETFQLTNEAFDAPRKATIEALKAANIEGDLFMIPHPGDYVEI